ncbi:hypothetical protein AB4Z46_08965 [Variovorax sp. M-6]
MRPPLTTLSALSTFATCLEPAPRFEASAEGAALRFASTLTDGFLEAAAFFEAVAAFAPGKKNAVAQSTTAARRRAGRNRWLETR